MKIKNQVKIYYPYANAYSKNNYWYVQSEYSKGDTLGSGSTVDEAWEMAFSNILEGREVVK